MSSPEDILEGLPPPSSFDGEPPNLRRDIQDELRDHLECAVQREVRRHDDPDIARQMALKRFGNPRQVARRLWLDAMKGHLMNQRIMIGTQVVMIIVICALCITMVLTLRQNQRMQEALLARIEAAGTGITDAADAPFAWPRFHVRVVDSAGKSVADRAVRLMGDAYNSGEKLTLTEKTNAEGRATFGPIRAGGYFLFMNEMVGTEQRSFRKNISIPPGPDQPPLEIVLPEAGGDFRAFSASMNLDELDPDLEWIALLELTSTTKSGESTQQEWGYPSVSLVIDHRGRVAVHEGTLTTPDSFTGLEAENFAWMDSINLDATRQYRASHAQLYVRNSKQNQGGSEFKDLTRIQLATSNEDLLDRDRAILDLSPRLTASEVSRIQQHLRPVTLRRATTKPASQ